MLKPLWSFVLYVCVCVWVLFLLVLGFLLLAFNRTLSKELVFFAMEEVECSHVCDRACVCLGVCSGPLLGGVFAGAPFPCRGGGQAVYPAPDPAPRICPGGRSQRSVGHAAGDWGHGLT